MNSKINLAAYGLWFATFFCQAALLFIGRRALPLMVRIYLATEMILSVVGMVVAATCSHTTFAHVYVIAGLIDDAVSLLLLLSFFEALRLRAREAWQGRWIPAALALSMFAVLLFCTKLPLPELTQSPWRSFMSCTHVAWTWMVLIVCLLPLYCLLTASIPDRKLLLLVCGMALYIGVHAGAVDYVIATRFSHSKLANAISDYSYFCSLGLWFAAIPTASTIPHQALQRDLTP